MYKVISIWDIMGKELPIDKMEFIHVDEHNCLARYKNSGFIQNYQACDGYTVIIKK